MGGGGNASLVRRHILISMLHTPIRKSFCESNSVSVQNCKRFFPVEVNILIVHRKMSRFTVIGMWDQINMERGKKQNNRFLLQVVLTRSQANVKMEQKATTARSRFG